MNAYNRFIYLCDWEGCFAFAFKIYVDHPVSFTNEITWASIFFNIINDYEIASAQNDRLWS